MSKTTLSFRTEEHRKQALDALASTLERDRSYVINEALDAYLAVQQWQVEEIHKGIAEAEAGDFADEAQVAAFFARWE